MDITYQYYNEVVLFFRDDEVDVRNGLIVIDVPEDNKPFDRVCEKIETQLNRLAETLDRRDKDITVRIVRGGEERDIVFHKEESLE